MRTVEEHLERVLAEVAPLDPLDVSLLDSRGCLLAEPVHAAQPLPPFDSSLVEGYAVRCVDLLTAGSQSPVALQVTDDVPPGYRASHPVTAGTAIRIGAGALMPAGADAVVELGETDAGFPTVAVARAARVGEHIRRTGSDLDEGAQALTVGALIGAREVALLAAAGRSRVLVRPKPRVVVISTGTELVEPGAPLTPGLIPDAAGYLLTAAAQDAGGMSYRAGPVPDQARALTETLEDQLVRADLVVTTGGVAAGTYDTIKAVLDRIGRVEFHRIAMSPGMAQGHGHLGPERVPLFTLPGSPTAAFIAFEVFVRPVVRRLLGHEEVLRGVTMARLAEPVRGRPGLRTYVPGTRHGSAADPSVRPVDGAGLPALRQADCLIVLPGDVPSPPAGAQVGVITLDGPA